MPASNRSTKQTRRSQHYKTMIDQDTAKGANDSQAKLINKQIIEASELCQVEQLLTVISKHVRQMNVINLSTAAHRLAKLASANDAEVNTHPVVSQLFNAVFMKVNSAEAVTIQPQAICNMTWSLAKLEFVGNPTLVHALANLMSERIHKFKPFELTTSIWALAKLVSTSEGNCVGDILRSSVVAHIETAVPIAALRASDLTDSCLTDMASALSMLKLSAPESVNMIQAEVMCRLNNIRPSMLISLLKSFAMMPTDCSRSVAKLAAKLLRDFKYLCDHEVQMLSQTIIELINMPAKRSVLASCELCKCPLYLHELIALTSSTGRVGKQAHLCCLPVSKHSEAVDLIDDDLSTQDRSEDATSTQDSFDEGCQDKELVDTYRVYVKNSFLHVESAFSDEWAARSVSLRRSRSLPPMCPGRAAQLLA
eukprot:gnl/TRDRNA2_/TRDRNA2_176564_c4_seq4.p1 gnl/TRDRNA2_/TRDRNA2_176564_c4~~gnl/TRDRNA2_/TRDRNA2_176564_c4_seq4.p1  ORF type:complete len:424 (-),score=75.57 gnl/TRDRNA2_/TRDRNA2_176564_c4_seq4:81-1352(-)